MHTVLITKNGYVDYTQSVTVRAGQNSVFSAVLSPNPTTTVTTTVITTPLQKLLYRGSSGSGPLLLLRLDRFSYARERCNFDFLFFKERDITILCFRQKLDGDSVALQIDLKALL